MKTERETGWLPDLLYRKGRFESGVAMFADSTGSITRFSEAPEDLRSARRLAGRAMLPGMVNAHSHSFQRTIRGRTEHRTSAGRDTFWTWREAMYHAANRLTPEDIFDVARMTFVEALVSGITAIGEFHYLHHAPDGVFYDYPNLLAMKNLQAASETGVRIALLRTAYVRAGFRREPNPGQARFLTPRVEDFIEHTELLRRAIASEASSRIAWAGMAWAGVAPHSVRAVPLDYLLAVSDYARSREMRMHMHVSEQPAEISACQDEYGLRPIELLQENGILDARFTGIHATHITEQEARALGTAKARVCACPTTERNLGDGIGPADLWTASGIDVCYGSDSNTQINVLEDARELEYHLRLQRLERAVLAPDCAIDGLARRLFGYATVSGAASLDAPGGSLEVNRPADFFTVDLNDLSVAGSDRESLLANIVFSAERTAVRDVYVNGRPVVTDGHHPLEGVIVERFRAVQRKLWGTPA